MSNEKYSRGGFGRNGGAYGWRGSHLGSHVSRKSGRFIAGHESVHGQSSVSAEPVEKGRKLQHLDFNDIDSLAKDILDNQLAITDVRSVSSYNWIKRPRVAIKYPGMPPKWNPPKDTPNLKSDHGKCVYRDNNAAHSDSGVLTPAAETLMKSKAELGSIDICADVRSIGLLLDFARDKTKESWRVSVMNIQGVIHFTNRLLDGPKQRIEGIDGFGHSFLDAYTKWEMEGSFSHQRLTSYKLGGLDLLVRYTADAYLPDMLKKRSTESTGDTISSALGNVSLNEEGDISSLRVVHEGTVVPQAALCDIKTRSRKRKENEAELITEMMPRLWLRQIPHLILAYHKSFSGQATFNDINVIEVEKPLRLWVNDNKTNIRRFAGMLHTIIKMAREREDGQFEIIFEEGDSKLQICERPKDAPDLFSSSVREKWRSFLQRNSAIEDAEVEKREKRNSGLKTHVVESQVKEDAGLESVSLDFTACDDECDYCGQCK